MAADGNEAQFADQQGQQVRPLIGAALQPCDGEPCGPNLEYDSDMLELQTLAAGKPETQFAPAQAPSWPDVLDRAQTLLERSRDLRIAIIWLRAALNTEGFGALPDGLALIDGWLERMWDTLHPQLDPDDQDPSARLSVLGMLVDPAGVLGELRVARLVDDRQFGHLRVRDIEVALGRLAPRASDDKPSAASIAGLFGDHPAQAAQVRGTGRRALAVLGSLQRRLDGLVGSERSVALAPLREVVDAVLEAVGEEPEVVVGEAAGSEGEAGEGVRAAPAGRRGIGSIDSRKDAVRALEQICDYLDRCEPTNPAQLFLRRAAKLIDMNFLELVRELAPEGLNEAARVMGVDPNELDQG